MEWLDAILGAITARQEWLTIKRAHGRAATHRAQTWKLGLIPKSRTSFLAAVWLPDWGRRHHCSFWHFANTLIETAACLSQHRTLHLLLTRDWARGPFTRRESAWSNSTSSPVVARMAGVIPIRSENTNSNGSLLRRARGINASPERIKLRALRCSKFCQCRSRAIRKILLHPLAYFADPSRCFLLRLNSDSSGFLEQTFLSG